MDIESYTPGEPCWQDHSSDDAGKAADFYSSMFGWDIPPAEGDRHGGYRNAFINGRMVAAVSPKMDASAPTVWSIYINTDDTAETAEKVKQNGGKVLVEPMSIEPFGTVAIFLDPTGAAFGTWEPAEHKGAGVRGGPGTIIWYELITGDVAKAAAFYSAVFDWNTQSHGGGEGGYTEIQAGGRTAGGMMPRTPQMPPGMPSYWGIYIAVDDTDAAAAKAAELGGTIVAGPMDIRPGRLAVVRDSTGAVFNILASSRGT